MSVQIALLDDHPLFRQGLRYILQTLPYVGEVVEAGTFEQVLALCRQRVPDVLLLDLQMPGMEGQEVAQHLLAEFPDLKIIVLSMFSADKFITHMMKLGARSYLPKDADPAQLSEALEDVLRTGYHFTTTISRALARADLPAGRPSTDGRPAPVALTPRELEILRLICEGQTAAQIAGRLFISRRTVEGHRQNLLEKTAAPNAAALVRYATQHGLLNPS